jgi:AcrR family transcriptional regulator
MPRPVKPLISREATAAAALRIIDEEGLEALSLERIAQAMHVRAPSLYHHFGDKADILAEVALLMYLETPVPRTLPPEAWREWHLQMSINRYEAILRHHRGAPLLGRFFPRHFVLPVYERSARMMTNAGVPEDLQITIMDGLEKLTFGSALYTAAAKTENVASFPEFDTNRYPYIATAIDADQAHGDDTFAETIWRFLRGFPDAAAGEPPEAPEEKYMTMLQKRR